MPPSRIAAEAEAAQTLQAELARVREEAEQHLADHLQGVRAEGEKARAAALVEAEAWAEKQREDALRDARETAQAESARALETELGKVREEQERRLAAELERARLAEQGRLAPAADSEQHTAPLGEDTSVEPGDAAARELANTLEEELARIKVEGDERLAKELTRVQADADQTLAAQLSQAAREADQARETAAREAREVAEAAAARTLQTEVERVRTEAERALSQELAKLRDDTDDQRSKEMSAISDQIAKLRETAAEQMRAAATEAIATEFGRMRSASPSLPAIASETVIPLAGGARSPESVAQTTDQEPLVEEASNGSASTGDDSGSYYSLWRREQAEAEPQTEATVERTPRFRQIGFALGAAACMLLAVGTVICGTSDAGNPSIDGVGLAAATASSQGQQGSAILPEPAPEVVPPGWVAISSSIEMDVFASGERLGSTADDRIQLAAGAHQIEVAHEQLDFRTTIAVEVEPDTVTSHILELPDGHLGVDGPPGADVWLDGGLIGRTPLADTPTAMGTHDLVVRHAVLGEWREEIVVGAGAPAVVTVGGSEPFEQ